MLPVINIAPLLGYTFNSITQTYEHSSDLNIQSFYQVSREIHDACRDFGFFYITFDYIPELVTLVDSLENAAKMFFAQSTSIKSRINMNTVGRAWRGYFCVGDEQTSNKPDVKEGLYLSLDQPHLDYPMHGANVYPRSGVDTGIIPPVGSHPSLQYAQTPNDDKLQTNIATYLGFMQTIGNALLQGISLSLFPCVQNDGTIPLDAFIYGRDYLTNVLLRHPETKQVDPLCLFRIFNYPALAPFQAQYNALGAISNPDEVVEKRTDVEGKTTPEQIFSVGEHTDYGLLTILYQDDSGGLQVRSATQNNTFIDAPPMKNTFVVNLGDILEKVTRGAYLSTPHRVVNKRDGDRISFPFFFDPCFHKEIPTHLYGISPTVTSIIDANEKRGDNVSDGIEVYKRWDGKEIGLGSIEGTYGNYILQKVSKVFPQLATQALDIDSNTTVE